MARDIVKTKTLRFTRVTRVTDNFVRVRATDGREITIKPPYDKMINVFLPFTGEGVCTVPAACVI